MAVTSDLSNRGTLTGTPSFDAVRTATNTAEYAMVTITNIGTVIRSVIMYLGGIQAAYRVGPWVQIGTQGAAVFEVKLGSGDTIYMMASSGNDLVYTVEIDTLS